jgi:hypothetical protein
MLVHDWFLCPCCFSSSIFLQLCDSTNKLTGWSYRIQALAATSDQVGGASNNWLASANWLLAGYLWLQLLLEWLHACPACSSRPIHNTHHQHTSSTHTINTHQPPTHTPSTHTIDTHQPPTHTYGTESSSPWNYCIHKSNIIHNDNVMYIMMHNTILLKVFDKYILWHNIIVLKPTCACRTKHTPSVWWLYQAWFRAQRNHWRNTYHNRNNQRTMIKIKAK